jgi:WD40 repeat protein
VWDTSTISAPAQAAVLPAATVGEQTDAVAFSPDGQFLVTGYHDGTISIWDTDLGDLASKLCRDTGPAISQSEWNQLLPGVPYSPPCQAAR